MSLDAYFRWKRMEKKKIKMKIQISFKFFFSNNDDNMLLANYKLYGNLEFKYSSFFFDDNFFFWWTRTRTNNNEILHSSFYGLIYENK